MCEKTCGNCTDFMDKSERCSNPMVYVNHTTDSYKTTANTPGCGFFYPIKRVE